MLKQTVINLSYDKILVADLLKRHNNNESVEEDLTIIDFTGVCCSLKNDYNVIFARELDPNHSIETLSIYEYVIEIGKLSKSKVGSKKIRNICVKDIPLYWLTPISVKIPELSWYQMFFFLKCFLREKGGSILDRNAEVTIILPSTENAVKNLCRKVLNEFNIGDEQIKFFHKKNSFSNSQLFLFSRNYAITAWKYLLLLSRIRKLKKNRSIFIENSTHLVPSIYDETTFITKNYMPKVIYDYFSSKVKTAVIPVFLFDATLKNDFKNKIYAPYIYNVPGLFEICSLFISSVAKLISLFFYKNIVKSPIQKAAINEMRRILLDAEQLINIIWLKRYFKTLKEETKVFYEDEFYADGRMVSMACKLSCNTKITTYGVQHALILNNHTVYCISDDELTDVNKEGDRLPTPDYFLVWGETFKKQFLKYNSVFKKERIIVAGNLKYLTHKNVKCTKNILAQNKELSVLWCTTTKDYAEFEVNLLKNTFTDIGNFQITIRMHPTWDIKSHILSLIPDNIISNFTFNNELSFVEQIETHTIILTQVNSTIFFDCLNAGKPMIRFITPLSMSDFTEIGKPFIYDVATVNDLIEAINSLRFQKSCNFKSMHFYNYDSNEVWESLLA